MLSDKENGNSLKTELKLHKYALIQLNENGFNPLHRRRPHRHHTVAFVALNSKLKSNITDN